MISVVAFPGQQVELRLGHQQTLTQSQRELSHLSQQLGFSSLASSNDGLQQSFGFRQEMRGVKEGKGDVCCSFQLYLQLRHFERGCILRVR
jgi:hypothetical protein